MNGKVVSKVNCLVKHFCAQNETTFVFVRRFRTFLHMNKVTCATDLSLKHRATITKNRWSSILCREVATSNLKTQELVTPLEMINYLEENKLETRKGFTCWQCTCPLPTTEQTIAIPKIVFINMTTGMFIDYDQKLSGSWHAFKDLIKMLTNQTQPSVKAMSTDSDIFLHDDQHKELESIFNSAIPVAMLSREEFSDMADKFGLKKLKQDTFKRFDVRVSEGGKTLLFPYHDPAGKLSGIRTLALSLAEDGKEKILDNFSPKVSPLSLFGCQPCNESDQVVVTGSPLDAMTVTQECKVMAVTLPKPHARLPQEILPRFEKYANITLWLGNSIQDWETMKTLIRKLGMERCCFVRPLEDRTTALQTLQKGLNLKNILSGAQPVLHKSLTAFHFLKDDIKQELNHVELIAGVKWARFPGLTGLLKGHRRGELTVFTGPTGAGKTTFMGEYSLDLCMQGVITLWGSFEIPNVRLAKMMVTQFSLISLEKNMDRFEEFASKFEELPLHFLTLHGQQSLASVLDVMKHAVYVHDIQHVVVDNLQFMMGMNAQGDRFLRQDLIVASFRQFATKYNCHITLVMHPRKENETDELTTNSIFGGVKAGQEADNIIILQDRRLNILRGRKYLQVTKNRFDGELGVIPLEFDKETKSFAVKKKNRASGKTEEEELNDLLNQSYNLTMNPTYPFRKKQLPKTPFRGNSNEFSGSTYQGFNKGTKSNYAASNQTRSVPPPKTSLNQTFSEPSAKISPNQSWNVSAPKKIPNEIRNAPLPKTLHNQTWSETSPKILPSQNWNVSAPKTISNEIRSEPPPKVFPNQTLKPFPPKTLSNMNNNKAKICNLNNTNIYNEPDDFSPN